MSLFLSEITAILEMTQSTVQNKDQTQISHKIWEQQQTMKQQQQQQYYRLRIASSRSHLFDIHCLLLLSELFHDYLYL